MRISRLYHLSLLDEHLNYVVGIAHEVWSLCCGDKVLTPLVVGCFGHVVDGIADYLGEAILGESGAFGYRKFFAYYVGKFIYIRNVVEEYR